jgi:hypothetical protein
MKSGGQNATLRTNTVTNIYDACGHDRMLQIFVCDFCSMVWEEKLGLRLEFQKLALLAMGAHNVSNALSNPRDHADALTRAR